MSEASRDSERALAAAKAICDGRSPVEDLSGVLVTLDHAIATVLLAAMGGDAKKAVGMLHEGTIPSVEERIMLYASKQSN